MAAPASRLQYAPSAAAHDRRQSRRRRGADPALDVVACLDADLRFDAGSAADRGPDIRPARTTGAAGTRASSRV